MTGLGPGEFVEQTRQAYYESTHRQAIEFEIARQIVWALVGDGVNAPVAGKPELRRIARHQLFPQVARLVRAYVDSKVTFGGGVHPCELGMDVYVQRIVERLLDGIQPDDTQGEPPLLPLLNRYKPIGTTADVNFMTTRYTCATERSHINQVVLDAPIWEATAAFGLEKAKDLVKFYARNDSMGLVIPYDYQGVPHSYEPDFLVRLFDDRTLVLEIKGQENDQTHAKHQAAKKWVGAINNWGKLGRWEFHVCYAPNMLEKELRWLYKQNSTNPEPLPVGELDI